MYRPSNCTNIVLGKLNNHQDERETGTIPRNPFREIKEKRDNLLVVVMEFQRKVY